MKFKRKIVGNNDNISENLLAVKKKVARSLYKEFSTEGNSEHKNVPIVKQIERPSLLQDDRIGLKTKFDSDSFRIYLDDMSINKAALGNKFRTAPNPKSNKVESDREVLDSDFPMAQSDLDYQNELYDDITDVNIRSQTKVAGADFHINSKERQEGINVLNSFGDSEIDTNNVLFKLSFLSPSYPSSPAESPPRPSTPDLSGSIISPEAKLDSYLRVRLDDSTVSNELDRVEEQNDKNFVVSKLSTQIINKLSESSKDLKPVKSESSNELPNNLNKGIFQTDDLDQQPKYNDDAACALVQASEKNLLVKALREDDRNISEVIEEHPESDIIKDKSETVISEEATPLDHFLDNKSCYLKGNRSLEGKATDFLVNFNRQQSESLYSHMPMNRVGVFKYFCNPPHRNEILDTLSQYGMAHAKYEKPFCSNIEDLPSVSL